MSEIIPQNTPQKQCTKCGRWLPFNAFSRVSKAKDGLNWRCRECKTKRQRETRTPIMQRRYNLQFLYGLTLQKYERMVEEQGGVCAVCGQPEIARNQWGIRRLSIDHDHETGEIRKLLCSSCNVALGRLQEDPGRIRALADYAEWCQSHQPTVKIVQLTLFA
jgi:hypothetical protein